MNKPTYQEQERKIHEAYIENKVRPFNANFCFCGTLAPDANWSGQVKKRIKALYPYSVNQYGRMEKALFSAFPSVKHVKCGLLDYEGSTDRFTGHKDYEEWLFKGMSAALEVLKKIHIEQGEVIDETPIFKKRQLATT